MLDCARRILRGRALHLDEHDVEQSLTHRVRFFFKQKTAYEIRPRDWSSDVCSSDLNVKPRFGCPATHSGISGTASSNCCFPALSLSEAGTVEISSMNFRSTKGTRNSRPHAMLITSPSLSNWLRM